MKRLLLLTLGLTMIGAAKAQEEKLETLIPQHN